MTETRHTYTARGIPDLLDLLPVLFGFTPKESFIAIAAHGESRRFGFRLRMDVPPLEHVGAAAVQIAAYLRRQEPDGVVLVAVTDRATVADALVVAVTNALGDTPVLDAVRTDGESYWAYHRGRPGEAMPYVGQCSPAVVDAVVGGMQILPDRETLVARFAPVSGQRKLIMAAATDEVLGVALRELSATPRANLGAVGIARLQPIIDAHAAGRQLSDTELATLAIWASSVGVRDEVWARMRRETAVAAHSLWTTVAQSVVAPFEPPVLCLAAFAAWLVGDGAQALIAVERALQVEPGYSMARLLLQMLDSGFSPESWAGFDAGSC
ncbi:MAG: DUF4192 domain-containing protein [Actinomycetota bacterium]|nr:DUF4192 domain-containing protein [Actinomycetota bacterium]